MYESIDRGRSMARPKRIDDVFDLPARQVQRATTHRSLWAVRLPPTGRRVGRWKRRGDDVDESPDLGRFTDHSGRCPETVHEAAASRRRLDGRERPLPSSALRGLWTAIGPDKVAPTTLPHVHCTLAGGPGWTVAPDRELRAASRNHRGWGRIFVSIVGVSVSVGCLNTQATQSHTQHAIGRVAS